MFYLFPLTCIVIIGLYGCHYLSVYSIEASLMAKQANTLVKQNSMQDRIVVIQGKIEVLQYIFTITQIVDKRIRDAHITHCHHRKI